MSGGRKLHLCKRKLHEHDDGIGIGVYHQLNEASQPID